MTLKNLITVFSLDADIQENFSELSDKLEYPERKIRLCFDGKNICNQRYNPVTDNIVLPIGHPALIAWYDYEVLAIEVPKKNVIDVYFSNVALKDI